MHSIKVCSIILNLISFLFSLMALYLYIPQCSNFMKEDSGLIISKLDTIQFSSDKHCEILYESISTWQTEIYNLKCNNWFHCNNVLRSFLVCEPKKEYCHIRANCEKGLKLVDKLEENKSIEDCYYGEACKELELFIQGWENEDNNDDNEDNCVYKKSDNVITVVDNQISKLSSVIGLIYLIIPILNSLYQFLAKPAIYEKVSQIYCYELLFHGIPNIFSTFLAACFGFIIYGFNSYSPCLDSYVLTLGI